MNYIQKSIKKLDNYQRQHKPLAFTYAVVKKYGEDDAGYKAALFTYYAFLALFPLLLVLITLTGYISHSYPEIQKSIIEGATNYIPVLGAQLTDHVGGFHSSGIALAIGLLFTIYGSRGVAEALQYGIRSIWGIPKADKPGFPKSTLNSLKIIIVGGSGFILAAISVGVAGSAGRGAVFSVLAIILNLGLLFGLFTFLINACLPKRVSFKQTRLAAVTAAIGLVVLQAVGGYVLTRELKSLDALYSFFAVSLGLLFWIYLQAQIIFYAVEIASVSDKNDWPRSLSGKDLTPADKRAADQLKSAV